MRGSAEERRRVNSDGALLERWFPKLLFSDIKTTLYQQKTDCNLQNMRDENYRLRSNNFQLFSTFEAAQRMVSRG